MRNDRWQIAGAGQALEQESGGRSLSKAPDVLYDEISPISALLRATARPRLFHSKPGCLRRGEQSRGGAEPIGTGVRSRGQRRARVRVRRIPERSPATNEED